MGWYGHNVQDKRLAATKAGAGAKPQQQGHRVNNQNTTWNEVECHLLVTAISPQLREYIALNAKASVRSPKHSSRVYVFSMLQDRALVREMESLCRDAAPFFSKRCEKIKGLSSYNINESIIKIGRAHV